jgi:hypothetical protein
VGSERHNPASGPSISRPLISFQRAAI